MAKRNKFLPTIWGLLKGTINRSRIADPVLYAAAIAFFTIFSLPPTLNIAAAIAGKFFGERIVKGEIAQKISGKVGPESAKQIQHILEQSSYTDDSGIFFSIIGIAIFLFSATVAFSFVQKAMNSIWNVKQKSKKGFLKFLIDRLISFSMVITLGLLLLLSLVFDPLLILLHDYLEIVVTEIHMDIMEIVNFLLSFLIITIIFAVIFKFLPDAKVKWRNVWIGAVVTAVLFEIGTYIIGVILRTTNIASAYGTAGSLAAILLWVFYSAIILLIGAEFTYVYSKVREE